MAGDALHIFRDVITALEPSNETEKWWENIRFAAWHIWKNGRESMGAAIMNVLLSALAEIKQTVIANDQGHNLPNHERIALALKIVDQRIASRENTTKDISKALQTYIESSLFSKTNSNPPNPRSEERRVGKECRSRWSPYH